MTETRSAIFMLSTIGALLGLLWFALTVGSAPIAASEVWSCPIQPGEYRTVETRRGSRHPHATSLARSNLWRRFGRRGSHNAGDVPQSTSRPRRLGYFRGRLVRCCSRALLSPRGVGSGRSSTGCICWRPRSRVLGISLGFGTRRCPHLHLTASRHRYWRHRISANISCSIALIGRLGSRPPNADVAHGGLDDRGWGHVAIATPTVLGAHFFF